MWVDEDYNLLDTYLPQYQYDPTPASMPPNEMQRFLESNTSDLWGQNSTPASMPPNELMRFFESNISDLEGTQGSAGVVDSLMRSFYPQHNQTTADSGFSISNLFSGIANKIPGLVNSARPLISRGIDLATSRGGMAGIAALLSAMDRPRGAGPATGYAGYKPLTRTMEQGRYGPVARYAASGGIVNAYANGGATQTFPMQDGGFVMTKRAVDGAGGPQGMKRQIPEAVPIRGPGHGTSDSIPAYIEGQNGTVPARVSNGEMYVPPGRDTRGLYALMRALEKDTK